MADKNKKATTPEPAEEIKADRNMANMAAAELAHEAAIAAYNTAFAATDMDAMREAEEAIVKAEGEFAEAAECEVFARCKATDHPLREAAKIHSYRVIKHKTTREDRIVTGLEKTERERPIDLVRLATKCHLPTLWKNDVENLNQILTLLAAKEMGASAAELKAISQSYYMSKVTAAVDAGKTPMSNTQLVKMLQGICDKVLGESVVRVNNHDIAYIIAAHTKKGRGRLAVGTADHALMHRLFLDVMHRCVTGAVYEVEFKKNKA